jgi:hypothetical protein
MESSLRRFIEEEVAIAKAQLDENKNPVNTEEDIAQLKAALDDIWGALKNNGFASAQGTESQYRASTVIMQGIIERAQIRALKEGEVKSIEGNIITPRMCTPLMLESGKNLSEVDLSQPISFAHYRKLILDDYLQAGGVLNIVYSHNARTALADKDAVGLAQYESNLMQYGESLRDRPVVKIDMDKFPSHITGALYYVDGMTITVEAKQVAQAENVILQTWAIKVGESCKSRVEELNDFFKENDASDLVKPLEFEVI